MRDVGDPHIYEYDGQDFTEVRSFSFLNFFLWSFLNACLISLLVFQVSFIPDFERFGIKKWSEDFIHLLHRRAVDLAVTLTGVSVTFNEQEILVGCVSNYDEQQRCVYSLSGYFIWLGLVNELRDLVEFAHELCQEVFGKCGFGRLVSRTPEQVSLSFVCMSYCVDS